ncbi:MAG: diguanylate cyclase domain-containing protein [Microthrixaceae bacterium]
MAHDREGFLSEPPGAADNSTMSVSPDARTYRRVLDAAGVAVASIDPDGHLARVNPAFARLCGRAAGELHGLHLLALCPGIEQPAVLSAVTHVVGGVSEVEEVELRARAADGHVRTLRLTLGAATGADGRVLELVAVAADLTDERRADRRRRQEALGRARERVEDPDTGLPNLRAQRLLVASAVRRSARNGAPFGVLRCDVGDLDALERDHGAELTRVALDLLGDRLTQRLRPGDTVVRTGTGRFLVLAEDLGDPQDAAGVAYRLLAAVVEPLHAGTRDVAVELTLGVVVGDGGASPAELMAAADEVATEALEGGPGGFRIADHRPGHVGRPIG